MFLSFRIPHVSVYESYNIPLKNREIYGSSVLHAQESTEWACDATLADFQNIESGFDEILIIFSANYNQTKYEHNVHHDLPWTSFIETCTCGRFRKLSPTNRQSNTYRVRRKFYFISLYYTMLFLLYFVMIPEIGFKCGWKHLILSIEIKSDNYLISF